MLSGHVAGQHGSARSYFLTSRHIAQGLWKWWCIQVFNLVIIKEICVESARGPEGLPGMLNCQFVDFSLLKFEI